jgi:DNA-binding transcriptional ArsR family regulator
VPYTTVSMPTDEPLPPRLLQDTAALFALLSATVRLHILWLLARDDLDVGTLADETGQSVATVSHHLSKLKLAGLVRAHRQGKRQVYIATDPHVLAVIQLAIGGRLEAPRRTARTRHA